jgi:hypothetical protein
MITMSKESAFDWLWGTTLINLGLGALLWVWNTVALANDDFDWSSDQANALLWQGIGSGLWGFGVLVFVITLATSAVVGAIEGNPSKQVGAPIEKKSIDEKFKASTDRKNSSLKNWLDEDNK